MLHIVDRVGDVEISTVELSPPLSNTYGKFETCLFWDSGKSKVVERYMNAVDAIIGHSRHVVDAEVIKRITRI